MTQAAKKAKRTALRAPLVIPTAMALGMATIFFYFSSGPSLRVTFVPGVALAYGLYLVTCRSTLPPPQSILPPYLLALAVQFIHFSEEYLYGFHERFPGLWGAPAYGRDLFVVFNMGAYALFCLGALILLRRITALAMIPLFFIAYGVVGNAIGHLGFCIAAGGYFPGIWTSLAYWILGPVLLLRLWRSRTVA